MKHIPHAQQEAGCAHPEAAPSRHLPSERGVTMAAYARRDRYHQLEEEQKAMGEHHKRVDKSFTAPDLLDPRAGGEVLGSSDELFGAAANLLTPAEPIDREHFISNCGSRVDGWETRRRRHSGHDWCLLRMGLPRVIEKIDIDTRGFVGDAPQSASVEACFSTIPPDDTTQWRPLVSRAQLQANSHNLFAVTKNQSCTHLRLNIFPDGGVARLRAFGEPQPDWTQLLPGELVELTSAAHGGRALLCSDMFFGDMGNVIAPGPTTAVGDGWETRRRRGPGFDWLIIKLASPALIQRVLLDTSLCEGSYPEAFCLEGAYTELDELVAEELIWSPILERTPVTVPGEQVFQDALTNRNVLFSHVRLNIYPDGGVNRLRVYGYPKLLKKR